MLIELKINKEEENRLYKVCEELKIPAHTVPSHPDNFIEPGVYKVYNIINYFGSLFSDVRRLTYEEEFEYLYPKDQYGVADTIEQIKDFYKEEIEDPNHNYIINIDYIYQDKNCTKSAGTWRWCKWGEYIGKFEPKCEYLNDEDFGPDFQGYVIVYHIYPVFPMEDTNVK